MKDDRDVEKTLDLPAFVAELRRLADALEADGTYEIEVDGELVQVPGFAIVSIEHERDGGLEELEFQLKWGEPEDEDTDTDEDEADGSEDTGDDEADAGDESETADGPKA